MPTELLHPTTQQLLTISVLRTKFKEGRKRLVLTVIPPRGVVYVNSAQTSSSFSVNFIREKGLYSVPEAVKGIWGHVPSEFRDRFWCILGSNQRCCVLQAPDMPAAGSKEASLRRPRAAAHCAVRKRMPTRLYRSYATAVDRLS